MTAHKKIGESMGLSENLIVVSKPESPAPWIREMARKQLNRLSTTCIGTTYVYFLNDERAFVAFGEAVRQRARSEWEQEQRDGLRGLVQSMEDLPPEAAKVLRDNLWTLYTDDPPKQEPR